MSSRSHGGSGTHATAPASEMTPPSSVRMSQQHSQSAASAALHNPLSTPGSAAAPTFPSTVDSDGDAVMADGRDDDAEMSSDHRHSNHNRQSRGAFSGRPFESFSEPAKGDALFNLCETPHLKSRPHCSQNMLELYGLNDLARSVARTDPVTGEKINKLRKSYEGHIKAMQIAGKAKATKMEHVLTAPLNCPDDIWAAERGGREKFKEALDDQNQLTATFSDQLSRAFAGMAPGPLPGAEAQKFRAYLGTDEAVKPKPDINQVRSMSHAAPTPTAGNAALTPRLSRPERSGSKRSYGDDSFQGYGEGIDPDFGDGTGGDDGSSMSKKRKLGFEGTSRSVEVGGVRR